MIDFHVGDKVVTDFYPKDKDLVRSVIKVQAYPSGYSQTNIMVTSSDRRNRTLECDAAWYSKTEGVDKQ